METQLQTQLKARVAMMPGVRHHGHYANRQDMCHIVLVKNPNGGTEAAFVGCDGCSQSATSEVGAGLVSHFLAEKLVKYVADNDMRQDHTYIRKSLYDDMMDYMRGLIALLPYGEEYLHKLDTEEMGGPELDVDNEPRLKRVYRWVIENMLFTVVGAYVSTNGVMTFQRGDGGYYVDGDVHTEDHKNMPPYPAYGLVPSKKISPEGSTAATMFIRGLNPTLPPPGFTGKYFEAGQRVAVFSDGMPTERIDEVWELTDPVTDWDSQRNLLQKQVREWFRSEELRDDLFLGVFTREPVEDWDVS